MRPKKKFTDFLLIEILDREKAMLKHQAGEDQHTKELQGRILNLLSHLETRVYHVLSDDEFVNRSQMTVHLNENIKPLEDVMGASQYSWYGNKVTRNSHVLQIETFLVQYKREMKHNFISHAEKGVREATRKHIYGLENKILKLYQDSNFSRSPPKKLLGFDLPFPETNFRQTNYDSTGGWEKPFF